jgi:glycogen debranching enzyme
MGIAWPWLLGPYLDAHLRIYRDPTIVARVLAPFEAHFQEAGLGSISEIFEAEPPYLTWTGIRSGIRRRQKR